MNVRGHVHQRHRRQQHALTTAPATATACGSSPRARRPARTPPTHALRLTLGGENDSPARNLARFVTEVAGSADHRAWTSGSSTGSTATSAAATTPASWPRGFPAARFTEPTEDFAHQHQDVRVEDGVQFGDLPEFCDFDYIAGVARVNGAALWSLAQAPGMPRERRDRRVGADQRHRAALVAAGRHRGPGGLRGGVAADDQPVLDPRHRRRQRRTRRPSTCPRTTSSSACGR